MPDQSPGNGILVDVESARNHLYGNGTNQARENYGGD